MRFLQATFLTLGILLNLRIALSELFIHQRINKKPDILKTPRFKKNFDRKSFSQRIRKIFNILTDDSQDFSLESSEIDFKNRFDSKSFRF